MKIIFLDIDGVLNSARSCAATGDMPRGLNSLKFFDPIAIALIQKICAQGVQCVLSSTWRLNHHFKDVGSFLGIPIMGATPVGGKIRTDSGFELELASRRGVEIDKWFNENKHLNIEKYIIIDDDSDILEHQRKYLVQTTHDDGFSFKNYLVACKLLEITD